VSVFAPLATLSLTSNPSPCPYTLVLGCTAFSAPLIVVEMVNVLMGTHAFVRSDKRKNVAFQRVLLRNLNANITRLLPMPPPHGCDDGGKRGRQGGHDCP
jgi:hypothetical protein